MSKNNIKTNHRIVSDHIHKHVIAKFKSKEFIDSLVARFNTTDVVTVEYNLGIARPKGFIKEK